MVFNGHIVAGAHEFWVEIGTWIGFPFEEKNT